MLRAKNSSRCAPESHPPGIPATSRQRELRHACECVCALYGCGTCASISICIACIYLCELLPKCSRTHTQPSSHVRACVVGLHDPGQFSLPREINTHVLEWITSITRRRNICTRTRVCLYTFLRSDRRRCRPRDVRHWVCGVRVRWNGGGGGRICMYL